MNRRGSYERGVDHVRGKSALFGGRLDLGVASVGLL